MRVIAGRARSMPLKAPKTLNTRPTTDRIKETLFNILQGDIEGSVFVDVFSGSVGIGIEALSRGAKRAYFIENEKEAIECITDNLHFTKFEDKAVLLKQDAIGALSLLNEKSVDIIFMDPPYKEELERKALEVLSNAPYVTEDTMIIIEAELSTDFSYASGLGFDVYREKTYKTNKHVFLRKIQN
ncbi:MAG: 16S rRNA (guanine(966)-N(2))-methyltransferase RsmD [Lachnospiraceae bacterium]|nr:16S rRNA (guanine(966)-N(2))-methyltransferase RsmD [Lachnospiraceae bacterium]